MISYHNYTAWNSSSQILTTLLVFENIDLQRQMITANAFIDWDSARRVLKPKWDTSAERNLPIKERVSHIEACFTELQSQIIRRLTEIHPKSPIRITKSRIYHGWHRGKTPTDDRRAWEDAVHKIRPVIHGSVSYLPDVEYGNFMTCGGIRVPLFDTLRTREGGIDQQKMVDTALVADLLSYCRSESRNFHRGRPPEAMAIIIGDDDDLLPGAFVSEKWGLPTLIFRLNRSNESKFINIDGIIYNLRSENGNR